MKSETSAPQRKEPYVKPEPTWIALLPKTIWKSGVKYRWQLAPAAATLVVFAAGEVPGAAVSAVVTALLGSLLFWGQRSQRKIAGRMWLSVKERETAAGWMFTSSCWSVAALFPLSLWVEAALLVAATAYYDYRWVMSRIPPKRKKLSLASKGRMALWADNVAIQGHDALKGSSIIRSSASEPADGALFFRVQLRPEVHNADAASDASRKSIEALLGLPSDCVTVDRVRDSSGQIEVTMSPKRHLEASTVEWTGPIVDLKKGSFVIGVRPDGQLVEGAWFNQDGVYHFRIMGNSGNGKTVTLRGVLSSFLSFPNTSLWLVDGGHGTSLPEIAPACDVYSVQEHEWGPIIDSYYNIMVEREKRRGLAGKSFWAGSHAEDDPHLLLQFDEVAAVRLVVGKVREAKILTILQKGRKVGMSIGQASQDSEAHNLLGGRQARELMAKGLNVMHRPGGKEGARLAQDGLSEKVDLLGLPEEAGFAAVAMVGKVVAHVCRIGFADRASFGEWVENYGEPITLRGYDLAAAGKAYAKRGLNLPEEEVVEEILDEDIEALLDDDVEEQDEDEANQVQSWIIKVLTVDGPKRLGELEKDPSTRWGRTHIKNNLRALSEAGRVTQIEGSKWAVMKENA